MLVTVGHDIARELYLGLAIDREPQVPRADGLDRGGRRDRDRRRTTPPRRSTASRSTWGLAWPISRLERFARPWGSTGATAKKGAAFLKNFVKLFLDKDASLAEVNPLIVTEAAMCWRWTAS